MRINYSQNIKPAYELTLDEKIIRAVFDGVKIFLLCALIVLIAACPAILFAAHVINNPGELKSQERLYAYINKTNR